MFSTSPLEAIYLPFCYFSLVERREEWTEKAGKILNASLAFHTHDALKATVHWIWSRWTWTATRLVMSDVSKIIVCVAQHYMYLKIYIYIYVLASGFLTIHKQPVEYSLPDVPMYFCKLLSPGLCLQWYAEDKNEPEILVFAKTLLPWQECYLWNSNQCFSFFLSGSWAVARYWWRFTSV